MKNLTESGKSMLAVLTTVILLLGGSCTTEFSTNQRSAASSVPEKRDRAAYITVAVLELIGICCVTRMWSSRDFVSPLVKLFQSLVILIPFFGPLFYFFLRTDPRPHGENPPDSAAIDPN